MYIPMGIFEDQLNFMHWWGTAWYPSISDEVVGNISFEDIGTKLIFIADNGILSLSSSKSETAYLTSHTWFSIPLDKLF